MEAETKAQKFVKLVRTKSELERKLTETKEAMLALEGDILAEWEQDAVQQMKVDGVTLYVNRQLWAGAVGEVSELVGVLKQHEDSTWLIGERYNSQQLSAWMREFDRDEDGMPIVPDHLKHVMKVTERFSLRARQS